MGPFELLVHAEGHLRNGDDFDRRIALISFDNAIEVSITTYLSLNPLLRGNRHYAKTDVEKWLTNYHTKLDFVDAEIVLRQLTWQCDRHSIIWAHGHRNEQYHGGNKGTPEKLVLNVIREAALWIFALLYDVQDVEILLEEAVAATLPPASPQRDGVYDRAIDGAFGLIEIRGQPYYTSEVLFAVDYEAYRDLGAQLCQPDANAGDGEVAE